MLVCPKCSKEYSRGDFCTTDGTKLIPKENKPDIHSSGALIKNSKDAISFTFNLFAMFGCFCIYRQIDKYRYVSDMQFLFAACLILLVSMVVINLTSKHFYIITSISLVLTKLFMISSVYNAYNKVILQKNYFRSEERFYYFTIQVIVLIFLFFMFLVAIPSLKKGITKRRDK